MFISSRTDKLYYIYSMEYYTATKNEQTAGHTAKWINLVNNVEQKRAVIELTLHGSPYVQFRIRQNETMVLRMHV